MNLIKFLINICLYILDFVLNLFFFPVLFLFFKIIEYLIHFCYFLCTIHIKFLKLILKILFLFNFIYLGLKNLKLFNFVFNFKKFYFDTNLINLDRIETDFNCSIFFKLNRLSYYEDATIDGILNVDRTEYDKMYYQVYSDLSSKPPRLYFINDFYKAEKNYNFVLNELIRFNKLNTNHVMHKFKLFLVLVRLKKILVFHSSYLKTKNLQLYNFPNFRKKLKKTKLTPYFTLFENYTAKVLKNYIQSELKLQSYIKQIAFLSNIDYLFNYSNFNIKNLTLKQHIASNLDEFNNYKINDVYFNNDANLDFVEHFQYNYSDNLKINYFNVFNFKKFWIEDFYSNFIEYKIKKKINLIFKIRFLNNFYKKYLTFVFKNFSLKFKSKFVLKLFKTFLRLFGFLLFELYLFFNFFKKLKYYYRIFLIYFEYFLLVPLIQLNYFYVCFVIKTINLVLKLFKK